MLNNNKMNNKLCYIVQQNATRNEKEQTTATCNVGEHHRDNVERQSRDKRVHLFNFIYIKF